MKLVKNGIVSVFTALIETAPKLDSTTRSFPIWGEVDYPEDEDNA